MFDTKRQREPGSDDTVKITVEDVRSTADAASRGVAEKKCIVVNHIAGIVHKIILRLPSYV